MYEEFRLIVSKMSAVKEFLLGEAAVSSTVDPSIVLCPLTFLVPGKQLAKEEHVRFVLTSAPVVHFLLVAMCRMQTCVCVTGSASQIMVRSWNGNASTRSFFQKTLCHSKKRHKS
jgi:hypothetical protein